MSPLGKKVVDILQKDGLLDRHRLQEYQQYSATTAGNILDYLLLGGMSLDRPIDRYLREVHRLPVVCLDQVNVEPEIVRLLPREICVEHTMVVFHRDDEKIYIAMAEDGDNDIMKFVRQHTHLEPMAFLADRRSIMATITRAYDSTADDHRRRIDQLIARAKVAGTDAETMAKEAPIIELFNHLLTHALRSSASDLHLEPTDHDVVVRLRIDGMLQEVFHLPRQLHDPLVARMKILSHMRIDEHLRPQDARFTYNDEQASIAVRVSIVPTLYGPKAVLRFLNTDQQRLQLEHLGLPTDVQQRLQSALARPNGLILVTGPTGSGKTTTLYSILNALRDQHVNISTIEDPIEYHLPGVTQIQVHPQVGLTFATGLRSILRQDPDIILVGEIRDRETAEIAINAALTGHLVLSSLHTNSAAGAVTRLLDMGIEPYLIASTVRAIVNQRLARTICTHCRRQEPIFVWPEQLGVNPLPADQALVTGAGCAQCFSTGYAGRVGVFEELDVTEDIQSLIMRRASATDIARQAATAGMPTLKADARQKILSQLTTPQEVLRVME